jgi:hypothetical protein
LDFFFIFFFFLPLDPDPDSESGSRHPIESGSNPDPDPQPCAVLHHFNVVLASAASASAIKGQNFVGRFNLLKFFVDCNEIVTVWS